MSNLLDQYGKPLPWSDPLRRKLDETMRGLMNRHVDNAMLSLLRKPSWLATFNRKSVREAVFEVAGWETRKALEAETRETVPFTISNKEFFYGERQGQDDHTALVHRGSNG